MGTAGLACSPLAATGPTQIIDTHTHFYDPTRPQGVPWPGKKEKILYRPVLPEEFQQMTQPLGIKGTVVVEASPWLEDNQWVLELAANYPIIVGTVGNLEPGKPGFRGHLSRFAKNRLFRGIRFGALWGRDPGKELPKPEFLADLNALAQMDLELDVVGGPPILAKVLQVTDRVPGLRVVIDHLPFNPPKQAEARIRYQNALRELGQRPQVYIKVSNVLRRSGGRVPDTVDFYRGSLDELWAIFGADRLIYGSNWPVSDRTAPYAAVLKVVREYFAAKGRDATEKYFWKNSQRAYRWVART